MENWDEVKTAYFVAREGTVSGAADALGVHHATVIRHIDALEGRLGVKLFQRHARGYTATEAGEDLARVARTTSEQMAQLQGRLKGSGESVSGDLVVTALPSMASALMPIIADFQQQYPDIRLQFMTGERLFRLEYGEAHVAIRAGNPPEQPDNVVQRLTMLQMGLFTSARYIKAHGAVTDLTTHRIIGPADPQPRAPFLRWLMATVPAENIVFRSDDVRAGEQAIKSGIGVGFALRGFARANDFVEVMEPREEWFAPIWLVTHVDLHRTVKVQAFLKHLKENVGQLSV
ncbi:MAG: LysR family transcriptional regulator [Pseudomonadota bacterium]